MIWWSSLIIWWYDDHHIWGYDDTDTLPWSYPYRKYMVFMVCIVEKWRCHGCGCGDVTDAKHPDSATQPMNGWNAEFCKLKRMLHWGCINLEQLAKGRQQKWPKLSACEKVENVGCHKLHVLPVNPGSRRENWGVKKVWQHQKCLFSGCKSVSHENRRIWLRWQMLCKI